MSYLLRLYFLPGCWCFLMIVLHGTGQTPLWGPPALLSAPSASPAVTAEHLGTPPPCFSSLVLSGDGPQVPSLCFFHPTPEPFLCPFA